MQPIRDLITTYGRKVYHFAYRMTMEPGGAEEIVEETFLRAWVGSDKLPDESQMEAWLLKIAAHSLERRVGEQPEVTFDLLDDTLRSEATRTDIVQSLTSPQRNFLLWELKQGCMTSVINCLSAGERVAFVLSVIMGKDEDTSAAMLGISTSAFKVRLSRARKKVTDYLAPRCEHVNPNNPCHCPSRLGVAMNNGFVSTPNSIVRIRPSFGRYGSTVEGEDAPLRDVMAIYQSLPAPELSDVFVQAMLARMDSGEWAERARKKPAKAK